MNTKEDHQDKCDSQVRERSVKIDQLKDAAGKKEAEAKIKYYEQVYRVQSE